MPRAFSIYVVVVVVVVIIVIVQSLSHVRLLATPWIIACQPPLFATIFGSLFKFMLIELMILLTSSSSAAFFFSCLQSFPALRSFPVSWLFTSGGQSIGASASTSVLPMNTQD